MDNQSICTSVFKEGQKLSSEYYTKIWITLINQLEKSKQILSGV